MTLHVVGSNLCGETDVFVQYEHAERVAAGSYNIAAKLVELFVEHFKI